jgi:hypothetical protein
LCGEVKIDFFGGDVPLWLAYIQKDHPRIVILKIKDYITLLFGLGLKGWNVSKGYGIMCGALASAWGTPGNMGNTVGASCQTIGNFMGHFRGQGEPAPTKLAPSPSSVRPFSGHINPPKMLETDPCGWLLSHFIGYMKFLCVKLHFYFMTSS